MNLVSGAKDLASGPMYLGSGVNIVAIRGNFVASGDKILDSGIVDP